MNHKAIAHQPPHRMKSATCPAARRGAAAFVLAILCSQGALSMRPHSPPPAPPPAGQYQIDKSHASLRCA